jgi:hypothetical protein
VEAHQRDGTASNIYASKSGLKKNFDAFALRFILRVLTKHKKLGIIINEFSHSFSLTLMVTAVTVRVFCLRPIKHRKFKH